MAHNSRRAEPPNDHALSESTIINRKEPLAILDAFDRSLFQFLGVVASIAFSGMLITISASVLLREAFHILAPWIDEITLYYLLTWYVFLSAAVLSRRTAHISVDVFYRSLTPSIQRLVAIAITIVCATLCVYLSSVSIRFVTVAFEQGQTSESGYLPIWIGYLSVPVGLGLTALGYIFNLMYILRDKRGQ